MLNLLVEEENEDIGVKVGETRKRGSAARGLSIERDTKGEDRAISWY
jgi:hypothetical protein